MNSKLILVGIGCVYLATTFAAPVQNIFRPGFNFTQIVSQDSCAFAQKRRDSVGCNPALFEKETQTGLSVFLASQSDGDSVETGRELIFDKIDKELLQDLFEKRNFNSWGGGLYLQFATPYFYLTYEPAQVNANMLIFNPSFPEIYLDLNNMRTLALTSGMTLEQVSGAWFELNIGGSLFQRRSKFFRGNFSLASLSSKNVEEILEFQTESSLGADVSLALLSQKKFIPHLNFMVRNIHSSERITDAELISERSTHSILTYETYSKLSLGYDFLLSYGSVFVETSLPFSRYYEALYTDYINVASGYSLGSFNATLALARYSQSLGFNFGSSSSAVGVFYTERRSLGAFSGEMDKSAGFSLEIFL